MPPGPDCEELYRWAQHLFPIHRRLIGDGVRETLHFLRELMPGLKVHSVPSGARVLDWTVPDEWHLREAYIEHNGSRIVDVADNNLHILGYSTPVDAKLKLDELAPHLHSLPDQPEAIPYLNSYYRPNWGFCLRHHDRLKLEPSSYHVKIDASFVQGHLDYGEAFIPGETDEEILFSTYVCHPSMANDQVSGMVVLAGLAQWIASRANRFSTRILFVPEMIGSAAYISKNLATLNSQKTIAGLAVACVGDQRAYSHLSSRTGNTLSDRILSRILAQHSPTNYSYHWPNRGSDERNYCMPGVDLPIATFSRSKFGAYPEYHTSLDDLSLISPAGLGESLAVLQEFIRSIERAQFFRTTAVGEPMLGSRGLYPTAITHRSGYEDEISLIMNILAYADGSCETEAIAEMLEARAEECSRIIDKLSSVGLLKRCSPSGRAL